MITENIDYKVRGYNNLWSVIDNNAEYALLENCTYGDETCYLVVRTDAEVVDVRFVRRSDGRVTIRPVIQDVVCETYDDLQTALEDEGLLD